ncbi:MAG: transporter [Enterovirga sp.]|jgi:MFS family permease|nr:transporter [Enterovirga sp.]
MEPCVQYPPPHISEAEREGEDVLKSKDGSGRMLALLVLLFTLSLINYLDRVALSVAGSTIAADFHLTPVEMGYFFSSFLWSYVLCVVPAGIIADRYGSKLIAGLGISVWSLATIATGLSFGFASIVATRVVMGAGEATSYPAANRLIRQAVPPKSRGVATAIFNSGAYAGPAFGSILIGWLISLFGWRIAFVIAGLVGFVWLAAWIVFFRGRSEDAQEPAQATEVRPGSAAATSPRSSVFSLLRSLSMWGTAITMGTSIYALYFLLTWLPSYLQTVKGLDVKQSGMVSALPYLGAVVFSILISKATDRFLGGEGGSGEHRRPMIGLMMLCSAALLFTPYVDSIAGITVLFTISLVGIATTGSLNMALAGDLLTNVEDAGKVNALVVLGGNVFGILAPIVTGYIVQATGAYDNAFIVAGVLCVGGAVVSQTLTRGRIGGGASEPRPAGQATRLAARS